MRDASSVDNRWTGLGATAKGTGFSLSEATFIVSNSWKASTEVGTTTLLLLHRPSATLFLNLGRIRCLLGTGIYKATFNSETAGKYDLHVYLIVPGCQSLSE